jgi:hypothetical protein
MVVVPPPETPGLFPTVVGGFRPLVLTPEPPEGGCLVPPLAGGRWIIPPFGAWPGGWPGGYSEVGELTGPAQLTNVVPHCPMQAYLACPDILSQLSIQRLYLRSHGLGRRRAIADVSKLAVKTTAAKSMRDFPSCLRITMGLQADLAPQRQ